MSDDPEDGPVVRLGLKVVDRMRLNYYAAQCEAERAQRAEAEAADLREKLDRQQRKERYDQVIARYNRAHGQNPKITLKQVCEEMGESYTAVRKYRQRAPKRKTKK